MHELAQYIDIIASLDDAHRADRGEFSSAPRKWDNLIEHF